MLRLTLHQMRASAGRLAAAGLAIVLGTAFVAVSLLASATMRETTHAAVTSSYAGADLVATATDDGGITDDDAAQISQIPGVAGVQVGADVSGEITTGARSEWVGLHPVAGTPDLQVGTLTDGRDPVDDNEAAIGSDVAERLGVGLGDSIDLVLDGMSGYDEDPDQVSLEVVGLLSPATSFFDYSTGMRLTPVALSQAAAALGYGEGWSTLTVALDDGADTGSAQSEMDRVLDGGARVQTMQEVADERTADISGSDQIFTVLLLGFAAVALAVAALVISNTFSVLVAQRTRTLALLRTVGATRSQVRRTVLTEALILGLASSATGLLLAVAVMGVGLTTLQGTFNGVPLDTGIHLSPAMVIVTLGVGVAVTLLASLVPARAATRVAPLAALRPAEGRPARSGRARSVVAVIAVVAGVLMLCAGALIGTHPEALGDNGQDAALLLGLGVGVLGGLCSLVGVLLGSVFAVPPLVRLLGRLAGAVTGRSVPAQVGTANAVRNPRRTAATTNALVIGVALVVMMSTGAVSARTTLADDLDTTYPVDLFAATADGTSALSAAQRDVIDSADGISTTAAVTTVRTVITAGDGQQVQADTNAAAEGSSVAQTMRHSEAITDLADDEIVLSAQLAGYAEIADGDQVTVTLAGEGAGASGSTSLTARVREFGMGSMVTEATMAQISPDPQVTAVWMGLADGADPLTVSSDLQDQLTAVADPDAPLLEVDGGAVARDTYGQVIDTLLAVVVGLLAVAVVIALIGVANTLSLSILERRRETAMLRAMGMTRGQLRGMLAVEGVLISLVGALIGTVAGLVYGWAGAAVLLGGFGTLRLQVPWAYLLGVLVVALVAGVLASVLPARSAVRTPPAAALAQD